MNDIDWLNNYKNGKSKVSVESFEAIIDIFEKV